MTPARRFTVLKVRPTGSGPAAGFVARSCASVGCPGCDETHCGVEGVVVEHYHESHEGQELLRARLDADLSLGDVADRSGLSVVEVSGLQHGSRVLANGEQWQRLLGLVRGAPERPPWRPRRRETPPGGVR